MKKAIKIILVIIGGLIALDLIFPSSMLIFGGIIENNSVKKKDILIAKMLETGDHTICRKVKGGYMMSGNISFRQMCYESYINEYAKSSEICDIEEIKSDPRLRSDCYRSLAYATGDITYCDKSGEPLSSCMSYVATKNNDINICNKFIKSGGDTVLERAHCYQHFAEKENDPNVCKKDPYEPSSGICLSGFRYQDKFCENNIDKLSNHEFNRCVDQIVAKTIEYGDPVRIDNICYSFVNGEETDVGTRSKEESKRQNCVTSFDLGLLRGIKEQMDGYADQTESIRANCEHIVTERIRADCLAHKPKASLLILKAIL